MNGLSSEYEKGKGWRVCIGLLFLICISLFLHFRKNSAQTLEVGTVSSRYITSQVDFDFSDEEATTLLKQEAAKDIGAIYAAEVQEIKQKCSEVGDRLRQEVSWRENFPEIPYEKILQSLELIESSLMQARHTDARTFHRVHRIQPQENFFFLSTQIKEGKLPDLFWDGLKQNVRTKVGLDKKATDFLVSFFTEVPWQLEEDEVAERGLKISVENTVLPKITKVKAGTHLLCPGEKVTPRHCAMLTAMTKMLNREKEDWHPLSVAGTVILSSLFTISAAAYLRLRHQKVYQSLQHLSLLVTIILLTLAFFKLEEHFLFGSGKIFMDMIRYPLVIPFATILITIFIGWEVSLFASLFLTVALALSSAGDPVRIFIFNILCAFVALITGAKLHKRREVFGVCTKIFLATIPIIGTFHLWDHSVFSTHFITDICGNIGFLFLTAALVVGFLTVVESLFPVVTDMALVEYMDPHHPLLRRLSVEAPGTYQHSLVIGNLAEAAAQAIGANGLFCRTSALYHDVGKLFNPHYFSENQLGGFNMHQLLTPLESAQVIIAHVAEGERLAKKHRLPQPFIDIIREHHGTQLVYYFYAKQKEHSDTPIDEKKFRYPGPKPRSKESGILMIADTVEAASRALEEVTEETLTEMVTRLVSEKIKEGQFEKCELTFEELERVKKTMIQSLVVSNHLRIKYPVKN
jgi:putative nucleotidyltransferase with HDIG domain